MQHFLFLKTQLDLHLINIYSFTWEKKSKAKKNWILFFYFIFMFTVEIGEKDFYSPQTVSCMTRSFLSIAQTEWSSCKREEKNIFTTDSLFYFSFSVQLQRHRGAIKLCKIFGPYGINRIKLIIFWIVEKARGRISLNN